MTFRYFLSLIVLGFNDTSTLVGHFVSSIFDPQVTPMLPTKFRVNWPRGVRAAGFKANC